MAVRFDAAADRLLRTASLLNDNGSYTWMCWAMVLADNDANNIILSFNDNYVAHNEDLKFNMGANTFRLYVYGAGAGSGVNGGTAAANTWYHVAMVRSSDTSLVAYIDGVLTITNTQTAAGRVAPTRMEIGERYDAGQDPEPLNGRICYIKAWSAALTVAEIQQEMYGIWPARTANIYGVWPCFPGATERLADYSGNGYNWTAGGTLTDEDPPPVLSIPRQPAAYNELMVY